MKLSEMMRDAQVMDGWVNQVVGLEDKLEAMEAFVSAVWLSGDQMTLKSLREDETWRPALESLTAVIADETSAV